MQHALELVDCSKFDHPKIIQVDKSHTFTLKSDCKIKLKLWPIMQQVFKCCKFWNTVCMVKIYANFMFTKDGQCHKKKQKKKVKISYPLLLSMYI